MGLLFNLAFGSLAALIGLRFSDKTAARLTGAVPVIAGGLLGLSLLHAAHLLNSNIDYALTHGPIRLIGGHATEIPIAAQFWLFAIAILLLAWWALSTRIAAASVLIFAVAGGLGGTTLYHAHQNPNAPDACVAQWSTAHGVRLTPAARVSTVRLTTAVVARTKATIAPDQTCVFLSSTLDIVRREALDARVSSADMQGWMERELKSLTDEIGTPNVAPGEFLRSLPPPACGAVNPASWQCGRESGLSRSSRRCSPRDVTGGTAPIARSACPQVPTSCGSSRTASVPRRIGRWQ